VTAGQVFAAVLFAAFGLALWAGQVARTVRGEDIEVEWLVCAGLLLGLAGAAVAA